MTQKYFPDQWHWPELDNKWWFKAWNHWLNPLGNWLEPMPRPESRVRDARKSLLCRWFGDPFGIWLFWFLRNFAHNWNHYWIGIMPIGLRYHHLTPEANGWHREWNYRNPYFLVEWWVKGKIRLPYVTGDISNKIEWGIGWKDSGSFGSHFRKI
jgi:hypothetical protein